MLGRRRHGLLVSIVNEACSDGTDSTTQCNGNDLAATEEKYKKLSLKKNLSNRIKSR